MINPTMDQLIFKSKKMVETVRRIQIHIAEAIFSEQSLKTQRYLIHNNLKQARQIINSQNG